jgi:4-amino-4-deoxy-L-arabinose transferase-like glycosyltransferase
MPGLTTWLVIVLMVVACTLLGRLATEPFIRSRGPFQGDWLALAFTSITFGVIILGWITLLLAELGFFSITLLSGLWLALVVVLAVIMRRGTRQRDVSEPDEPDLEEPAHEQGAGFAGSSLKVPGWLQYALLGLWLIMAVWLFFRPHQYVLGAADAGVYVNLAASIADSGGILIDDPTLMALDEALQSSLLRTIPGDGLAHEIAPQYILPGFFVEAEPAGRITPQFYPLHPVWQAIAYALGGVQAALLMSGLWAILGSLSIYLVVREIAGWPVALLALVGLSLSAMQIWFARYPTTEMLTQFLLWAGLWATMLWLQNRRPRALWGLLGGLALGQVFLVRIDTYFLLLIPLVLYLWLRWSGRWRRDHWIFFIPIVALTAHSLLHAVIQSAPYFFTTFQYGIGLLGRNWLLPVGSILLGSALLLILHRNRQEMGRLARYRRPLAWLAVALLLLLVAYGWFIRPYAGVDPINYEYWYGGGQIPVTLDRENLIRLGWYLSPLGIALATAGICQMILTVNRQTAVLLGTGLIFSLLYIWKIQANPHQIYTMRRYVPAVLPFAIVATGALFGWLFSRRQKWIQVAGLFLAIGWLVSLGLAARGFVRQVDHQGIMAQLESIDNLLEPASILIFYEQTAITKGDTLGTPLRFLFGHDVYSVRDLETLDTAALARMMTRWRDSSRPVYWVGDSAILENQGLTLGTPVQVNIATQQLEGVYDRKPSKIIEPRWQLDIIPIN